MGLRVVFFNGVTFLLWVFLCVIYLGIFGFNVLLNSLGIIFGFVSGVVVALKHIRSIEKNGEFRTTPKTWAYILLTIIILVPIIFIPIFTFGPEVGIQMVRFMYPFIVALYAARVITFLSWERKNKRLILFDGFIFTRIYAFPEIQKADDIKGIE